MCDPLCVKMVPDNVYVQQFSTTSGSKYYCQDPFVEKSRINRSTRRRRQVVLYTLLVLLFLYSDFEFASAHGHKFFASSGTMDSGSRFSFGHGILDFTNITMKCLGSSSLTPKRENTGVALCLTPSGPNNAPVFGRCLYTDPVQFPGSKGTNSFSTMFSFSTLTFPTYTPGQGFTFFITPDDTLDGEGGGYLGWLNETTQYAGSGHSSGRNFAVEFDIHSDKQFNDSDSDHLGINVNSMNSTYSTPVDISLTSSCSDRKLYVWIDYDSGAIEVRIGIYSTKPCDTIISGPLDLRDILSGPMFVGFSSSTGGNVTSVVVFNAQTTIWDWSFDSGGKAVNIYDDDENCSLKKKVYWYMIAVPILALNFLGLAVLLGVLLYLHRLRAKKISNLEKVIDELQQLNYGPREFTYRELLLATNKFSSDEVLGKGGFGTVYRGTVQVSKEKRAIVAVKRISKTSKQGAKEFVAEVKVMGMLKHVNLVPLLGYCYERGEMLLVYDYMPNGNLQELLFRKDKLDRAVAMVLPWEMRMRILRGVAAALAFLHEECEQRVVHRDVKSSNVMLDKDFNARLGDFGLARLFDRTDGYHSTVAAGTIGYIAPEVVVTGTVTSKSDVYSFGAMALEVATGRKPADWSIPGEEGLVKWVWTLHDKDTILDAVDVKLGNSYDTEEMERVLRMGLSCCLCDPEARPNMRHVQSALQSEPPILTSKLPPWPVMISSSLYPDVGQPFRSVDSDYPTHTLDSVTDWGSQVSNSDTFLSYSVSAPRETLLNRLNSMFHLEDWRSRSLSLVNKTM